MPPVFNDISFADSWSRGLSFARIKTETLGPLAMPVELFLAISIRENFGNDGEFDIILL
jgi:hypothetical protein